MPRFLLRNFSVQPVATTPQVFVFDKKRSISFKTSIGNICSERDYYRIQFLDKSVSAEDIFSKIESEAAPVLERLVERRELNALDKADQDRLIVFLALQQTRSVGSRARYTDLGNALQSRFPNRDLRSPFTGNEDERKLTAIRLSFNLLDTQSSIFKSKTLVLCENKTEEPFIIGDEPVVLHNRQDCGPYGNLGIASPGVEIYMPITPDLLIGLWCPTYKNELQKFANNFETMKVLAVIGAGDIRRSAEDQVKNSKYRYELVQEQLSRINSGKPLHTDEENIDFFNSLQVIYAERYLISNAGRFSLPKKMILSNEKFRKGARFRID